MVIGYVRPDLPDLVFRDERGEVIPYGSRWGIDGPPQDTYSVTAHPERFAPLHTVADALIDYLVRTYDVTVIDDLACRDDLVRPSVNPLRAVRTTPAAEDAAPLTFIFSDFPGVVIHAGLLHDLPYPHCGCDACDDSLDHLAEEMELLVDAVVSGGYLEEIRGDAAEPWLHHEIAASDGSWRSSGDGRAADDMRERIAAAAPRLAALNGPWKPWPLRR